MAGSVSIVPLTRQSRRGGLPRSFDIVVAVAALLVLTPVMLAMCVAILVESGRPVLFRQRRLGRDGRTFMILKFKKFCDAVDGSGPHLTSLADGRMTRIGALLQKTKLDEVPQFLNVLAGDMALVGPRPESMRFADCFGGRFRAVLSQQPGIFGPNQILFRHEDALLAGRSDVEGYYRRILFPLKASVDLAYFARRTWASDLRLLLSASFAVCGGRARTEHLILQSAKPAPSESESGDLMPLGIDLTLKV